MIPPSESEKSLYLSKVGRNRVRPDGFNFIWIGLDSLSGHYMTQNDISWRQNLLFFKLMVNPVFCSLCRTICRSWK